MDKIKENAKYIVLICILIIIGFVVACCYISDEESDDTVINQGEILEKNNEEEKNDKSSKNTVYYVDIKGAVKNPGVYKMKENSRVIDVINSAGGLNDNANTSIINLSKKVFDEMFIIIYTNDQIKKYKNEEISTYEITKKIEESSINIDKNNDAQISSNVNDSKKNIVNINTATKEDLMSISGIGESKAKSIIEYRKENGNFKKIEDIKKVSGIGDSLFDKIKEYITT